MLHYWEGNSTNLGKLKIFKKQTIQIIFYYDTQTYKKVPFGNQANKLTTIGRHPFTFYCRSARIELKHLSSITHFPPDSVYLLGQLSKEDANSSTLDRWKTNARTPTPFSYKSFYICRFRVTRTWVALVHYSTIVKKNLQQTLSQYFH